MADKLTIINTLTSLISLACCYALFRRTPVVIRDLPPPNHDVPAESRQSNIKGRVVQTPSGEYLLTTTKNRVKVNDDAAAWRMEQDQRSK